jgi:hypothetical protein
MSIAALYNSLPMLEMADTQFRGRTLVFSKFAPSPRFVSISIWCLSCSRTLRPGIWRIYGRKEYGVPSGARPALLPGCWLADSTPFEYGGIHPDTSVLGLLYLVVPTTSLLAKYGLGIQARATTHQTATSEITNGVLDPKCHTACYLHGDTCYSRRKGRRGGPLLVPLPGRDNPEP